MVQIHILAIEPDAARQRALVGCFKAVGLTCKYLPDASKLGAALRQVTPQLIVLHAEPGSAPLDAVLKAVLGSATHGELPVALLCRDLRQAPFAGRMRTGVVALWEEAISARTAEAAQGLLASVAQRTGIFQGSGSGSELRALVHHLQTTQRSGKLELDAPAQPAGPAGPAPLSAFFARGALQRLSGGATLDAAFTRPKVAWTFAEVSRSGAQPEVVIDLGDEQVPIIEEDDGEDDGVGVDMAVDGDGDDALEVELEPEQSLPPAFRPLPSGPPPALLLVDDDEALCKMFSTLFKRHGFQVTTAADGLEGFETALRQPFDLVVADLSMPRMDGWGLLRQLRDDLRTRELPVAFLSCHDDFRESLRAQNAGAQAYFSKTVRLEKLVGQVSGLLEPRRALVQQLEANAATIPVSLATVGPQWLLRTLAERGVSGELQARDSWASYALSFDQGAPVAATALAGPHRAEGERAFNAFIGSRGAAGELKPGPIGPARNLTRAGQELIERAAQVLNENETRVREKLLLGATQVKVDQSLYDLYRQIGPEPYLEPARMICEEHLSAREVMSRAEHSPLLVEEVMRDLIRRGVVSLAA